MPPLGSQAANLTFGDATFKQSATKNARHSHPLLEMPPTKIIGIALCAPLVLLGDCACGAFP